MNKNEIIKPSSTLGELELRIYNALPRRWGDCNATILRKIAYRMELKEQILQQPEREVELLQTSVKFDITYE